MTKFSEAEMIEFAQLAKQHDARAGGTEAIDWIAHLVSMSADVSFTIPIDAINALEHEVVDALRIPAHLLESTEKAYSLDATDRLRSDILRQIQSI